MPQQSLLSICARFTKILSLLVCLVVSFSNPALHAAEPARAADSPKDDAAKSVVVSKVNINTASAEDIAELLTDIGQKKAEAIVAHRKEFGPFRASDDLLKVKGIGTATVEKNKERIVF